MSDEMKEYRADALGVFTTMKVCGIDSIQEDCGTYAFFFHLNPNMLTIETHSQTDLIQGKKGIVPLCWFQGFSSMQNK